MAVRQDPGKEIKPRSKAIKERFLTAIYRGHDEFENTPENPHCTETVPGPASSAIENSCGSVGAWVNGPCEAAVHQVKQ